MNSVRPSRCCLLSLVRRIWITASQKWEQKRICLLILSAALVVFGLRLAVGERFNSPVPFADDWNHIEWFEKWTSGQHDWSYVFEREAGIHLCVFTRLVSLGCFVANKSFDARLEFVAYCAVIGLYTALAAALLVRCTPRPTAELMVVLTTILLGLPFAGYRIAWGFLLLFSWFMCLSLGALYCLILRGQSIWGRAAGIVLLIFAGASIGSGCLAALAAAGVLGLRTWCDRRRRWAEAGMLAVCLGIFASFYLSMPHSAAATRPPVSAFLATFLKALSWPNVFLPFSCLVTLAPCVGLLWRYWHSPSARTVENEFLLATAALLLLQAAAIGMFRSDSGNFGMPSNRYTDMLVLLPLTSVACLLGWKRYQPSSRWLRVLGVGICVVYVFGGTLHFLYRMWPFAARENGEWTGAADHSMLPQLLSSTNMALPKGAFGLEPGQDRGFRSWLLTAETNPVLSRAEVLGVPLQEKEPGASNGFIHPGFPAAYVGRPTYEYRGNFSPEKGVPCIARFVSRSFSPRHPYLKFDLILDKKARFAFYREPGCSFQLVEDQTGIRQDLLKKLRWDYPFILRDRELVYARVTPGFWYHVEAVGGTEESWFAFSDPRESGRLTPLTEGVLNSGKLMVLAGVCLSALLVMVRRERAEGGSDDSKACAGDEHPGTADLISPSVEGR